MRTLIDFMQANVGRALRLVLGLVLIAAGVLTGGGVGTLLVVIGLVPTAMGIWGPCLIGFVLPQSR